jgi:hypothetical protein
MSGAVFACPDCGRAELAVARRLVLPGDRRSDEIALEIAACRCGFRAVAVTEHLMRVNIHDTASDYVGFRLPGAAVDLLAYLISLCPEPEEEYCPCRAHAILNRRDLRNRWNLLQSFAPFRGFALAAPLPRAGAEAPAFSYAPFDWTRDGDEYRALVDGREWRLRRAAPSGDAWELSVDGALGLDLDAWPSFWRRPGEDSPRRHEDTEK